MIFGYIFSTVGYALFYWGLHHFPFVDGGDRVSLIDCLGIPQAWGIAKGQPIQLNPTGGVTPPIPNQGSPNPTPSTGGIPPKKQSLYGAGRGGITPPQKPDCWQQLGQGALPMFTPWKNQRTGKTYYGKNPPGPICGGKVPIQTGPSNPTSRTNCWVMVTLPNFGGVGWQNRQTGKISMTVAPPGPICPPSTGKAQ